MASVGFMGPYVITRLWELDITANALRAWWKPTRQPGNARADGDGVRVSQCVAQLPPSLAAVRRRAAR